MTVQKLYDAPRKSTMLDYAVNVYRDGEFVVCLRHEGWSGSAVHEEMRFIREEFPASEGYEVIWD